MFATLTIFFVIWAIVLGFAPSHTHLSGIVVAALAVQFALTGYLVVDIGLVYYFARKIEPVTGISGAWLAFIEGSTWSQLRTASQRLGPALEMRQQMLGMIRETPRLAANAELRALIDRGKFVKAGNIIGSALHDEWREARRERRRAQDHERLYREGEALGLSEAEITAAIQSGTASARIAAAHEAASIRTAAKKIGYGATFGDLTTERACREARGKLTQASRALEEAVRLGVRGQVARHLAVGALDEALHTVRAARHKDERQKVLDTYRAKVSTMAASPERERAHTLIAELEAAEFEKRPFRKTRHELDNILDRAAA